MMLQFETIRRHCETYSRRCQQLRVGTNSRQPRKHFEPMRLPEIVLIHKE